MRCVLGIAVASDSVRGVLLRKGVATWAGERQRGSDSDLAADIGEVLAAVKRVGIRGATLRVAVGASMARLKKISGLPPLTDREVLTQIIRETKAKYFIEQDGTLLVGGVCVIEPGSVWAAVVDGAVCQSIDAAAHEHGIRVTAILPAAAVLHLASIDRVLHWADGQARLEIVLDGQEITDVRRRTALAGDELPTLTPVDALAAIGEHASRFADAFGAAALHSASPWIGLSSAFARKSRSALQRVLIPVAVMLTALSLAALSPLAMVAAKRRTDIERREIRATELWRAAESTFEQMTRANEILVRVDELERTRTHVVPVLAEMIRLLPDDVVVVRLDIEDGRGSVTLRMQDAASVLASLRPATLIRNVAGSTGGAAPAENGWEMTYGFELVNGGLVRTGSPASSDD